MRACILTFMHTYMHMHVYICVWGGVDPDIESGNDALRGVGGSAGVLRALYPGLSVGRDGALQRVPSGVCPCPNPKPQSLIPNP